MKADIYSFLLDIRVSLASNMFAVWEEFIHEFIFCQSHGQSKTLQLSLRKNRSCI